MSCPGARAVSGLRRTHRALNLGLQGQVRQTEFLGDLASPGDVRVFAGFDDASGQQSRVALAVGGAHQQDAADLVGDYRGSAEPHRAPGRCVLRCRRGGTRCDVVRSRDGRGHVALPSRTADGRGYGWVRRLNQSKGGVGTSSIAERSPGNFRMALEFRAGNAPMIVVGLDGSRGRCRADLALFTF